MRNRWIKGISGSIILIWLFIWGCINVIGNLQTGQQILSGFPNLRLWLADNTHAELIIIGCLMVFLSADKIGNIFNPIKIKLIGVESDRNPLISVRVTNTDKHEKRIQHVKMFAVYKRGTITDIPPRTFTRCDGLKDGKSHVMPPSSNFEVGFKASIGDAKASNALFKDVQERQLTAFFSSVMLEDGTEIYSKRHKIKESSPMETPSIPFSVVEAKYGAKSCWRDVTDIVRQKVTSNETISANTGMLGVTDPIYAVPKTLIIRINKNGKEYEISIPENESINSSDLEYEPKAIPSATAPPPPAIGAYVNTNPLTTFIPTAFASISTDPIRRCTVCGKIFAVSGLTFQTSVIGCPHCGADQLFDPEELNP